jgi:uracil-DNA glycosylase
MALTVEEKKAGSHLKLWEPFINFVFSVINNKQDVIWILLGKEAQKIKSLITNKTHTILEATHPAVHCYGGSGFLGSNVFKECNVELELRNKQIIQW